MTSFTATQTVRVGDLCPKCFGKTILKMNTKTNQHFVGCENFPECKFTSPYNGLHKTKSSDKIKNLFFNRLTKDAPKNMCDEEKIIFCDALGRFLYNKDGDEDTDFIWFCIDESIEQWPELKSILNVDKIYYALKRRLFTKE